MTKKQYQTPFTATADILPRTAILSASNPWKDEIIKAGDEIETPQF